MLRKNRVGVSNFLEEIMHFSKKGHEIKVPSKTGVMQVFSSHFQHAHSEGLSICLMGYLTWGVINHYHDMWKEYLVKRCPSKTFSSSKCKWKVNTESCKNTLSQGVKKTILRISTEKKRPTNYTLTSCSVFISLTMEF